MNPYDQFEADIEEMMGDRLRSDPEFGSELWSALANVDWYHRETKEVVSYSFRAAGGMIAGVIGRGDYMDWYCSGPYATVSDFVWRSLKKKGWIYDADDEICDEPGCVNSAGCGTPSPSGYRHTCVEHIPDRALQERAADSIRISYDFHRDGWVVKQASVFEWDADDDVCDEGWTEVAFIPAWQQE